MLKNHKNINPQKIISIHRRIVNSDFSVPIQKQMPNSSEEIRYFVSRFLEVKRKRNSLLKERIADA
jgi:hypothetical protein